MKSYYELRIDFFNNINGIIGENKGKTLRLSTLELYLGQKFGISKISILKALQPYVQSKMIKLNEMENEDYEIVVL